MRTASRNSDLEEHELHELLERWHDRYHRVEFIEADPIAVPHRYSERHDREIAGFLAATIAWGNRTTIVRNGLRMMQYMDDAPADFVRHASEHELALLRSFVHRTFNGEDLRDFVLSLRRMEEVHGGIGAFFEREYEACGSLPAAMAAFRREFFAGTHGRTVKNTCRRSNEVPPASDSACICGGWCDTMTAESISESGAGSRCRPCICRSMCMLASRRVCWDCLRGVRTIGALLRS